ncbi:MAG: hypothetical protein GY845_15670 [Planctomycetes bacterium]|nr:hypothetical protein [Planctomycetota bacterium]
MPLQIHDEPESVSAMVKETMELVMALDVPLKVNTAVGVVWIRRSERSIESDPIDSFDAYMVVKNY